MRRIPVNLLTQPVRQTVELFSEVFIGSRQFADLQHERMIQLDTPEAVAVVAQRIGQDVGIEPVILGSRDAVSVSETIKLLGIDGVDVEASFHQGFHQGRRE
jgi:hypothetical protein